MRLSRTKSTVTVLRSIAGLTQEKLAEVLDCSRMTIQAIESRKLRLSNRMAEKIALHTGVSMRWLLADKYKDPPVCERDLERPYTAEVFRITRAEVTDPRIDPLDIRSIENILAVTYDRLCDAACQAYHADEIIHFHYAVREFLEGLDARWPDSRPRDKSMDVAETAAKSRACLEAARQQKLLSNIGQP